MDWQPIETAPKDGTVIDLWGYGWNGKYRRMANCRWYDELGDGEFTGWEQEYAESPSYRNLRGVTFTHWMPLPPPPTS
jgi:hypothetical protein